MSTIDFNSFGFDDRLLRALEETGITTPTPVQAEAIPMLLKGKDLMAVAQTGTGKTAAFALPAIQLLMEKPIKVGPNEVRCLILAPTRELATQIGTNIKIYARNFKLKQTVVYGGMPYRPQIQDMKRGADILIATPGRLIDLLDRGHINLSFLEMLILDEADRMLDMGFIHDIRNLIALMPEDRQSLMFSATMPRKVEELGRSLLQDPEKIEVTPESTPVDRITQKVMFVKAVDKLPLLLNLLKKDEFKRVIIFTKTRYKADKVSDHIARTGITSEAIHGDKSQAKRQRVLKGFEKGKVQVLVATDVAARGIDINDITHVINYELPMEAESYVHRIGRTARAGSTGTAIAFCDGAERGMLNAIERNMKMQLPVDTEHDWHDEKSANKSAGAGAGNSRGGDRNRSGGRGGRSGGGNRDGGEGRREGSKARWGKPRRDAAAPRQDRRPDERNDNRNDEERRDRLANSNNYRRDRDQTPVKSLFDRPSRDDQKDTDRSNDNRGFKGNSGRNDRNDRGGRSDNRQSEGRRTEGGRSEGGRSEGRRFEGNRSEGRPAGRRPEGNRSEGGRSEGGRSEGGRNFKSNAPRRSNHNSDSRDDSRQNNRSRPHTDDNNNAAREHSRPARPARQERESRDFASPSHDNKPASRNSHKPGKSFGGKPDQSRSGGKAFANKSSGPVKGKRQSSTGGGGKTLFKGRP